MISKNTELSSLNILTKLIDKVVSYTYYFISDCKLPYSDVNKTLKLNCASPIN